MDDRGYQFDPNVPAPVVAVRNKLLSAEASQNSEESQIEGILNTIATLYKNRVKRRKDIQELRTWLNDYDAEWLELHDRKSIIYKGNSMTNSEMDTRNIDPMAARLVPMSRNPSVTLCNVEYRGYIVPYVEVLKVPVDDEGTQVYPISDSTDGPMMVYQHHGKYMYELSLDNRWLFDFENVEDLEKIIPLLADAMAVAAGYVSHGSPNRLNPHGPTMFGNHQNVPSSDVSLSTRVDL